MKLTTPKPNKLPVQHDQPIVSALYDLNKMPELIIEAGRSERHYWRDLWRYRELLGFLAWRDILVRYKQTVIGILWSVIRPVLTTVVFTIVFSRMAKMGSGDIPYSLVVFAGMLPWQFFSNSLAESSNSLIVNSNLISKVYFPRLLIPASSVIVCLVDLLISAVLIFALMTWFHFVPTWRVVMLPMFVLAAFAAAAGAGLWLGALTVKYRDFRYVVPFIVQFGLLISPVGFSINHISEKWRLIYSLNPMVGVINGFRWSLLKGLEANLDLPGFLVSMAVTVLLLASGIWYFRRMEKSFADVI